MGRMMVKKGRGERRVRVMILGRSRGRLESSLWGLGKCGIVLSMVMRIGNEWLMVMGKEAEVRIRCSGPCRKPCGFRL